MMVSFLTREQLEKLNTKRLLAYKSALMKCPEGPNWDECDDDRMNKSRPDWQAQYALVKEILATREHIEK